MPKKQDLETAWLTPVVALILTGVVEAGCGGSETLHAPFGEAVADAEPMTSPAPLPRTSARIATVTLAPGADQPLRKHPRFAYSSIHNMDTLHIKHYIIILWTLCI